MTYVKALDRVLFEKTKKQTLQSMVNYEIILVPKDLNFFQLAGRVLAFVQAKIRFPLSKNANQKNLFSIIKSS